MEFCGGGSIADLLKVRKQPLNEEAISVVVSDTLKGNWNPIHFLVNLQCV